VVDRDKTDQTTDIEFDFFDESPTVEGSPGGGGPRGRRRLPTRPPAPPGGPQLYRLGVLIAGAIVFAVILILVINSCRGSQKQSEYEGYVDDVGKVASGSAALGKQLHQRLTTPGIKLEELRGDIEGLRDQQNQLLASAQDLRPPGPLVSQQESLVEAMQFRVNGLDGLARGLTQVAASTNDDRTATALAKQAERLVASDVVYQDAFETPTGEVLDQQEVGDVAVPASKFVQNLEVASPTWWMNTVKRLTQSPQAGGLHGNGIQAVRVLPSGDELSPSTDNTVKASQRLAFEVVVLNSGDFQETQVPVTLVIRQDPKITKTQTIDVINSGDEETVRFGDFADEELSFSTQTTLQVSVEPVSGEQNTNNNTAQYRVIFTLQ
jgi:hypothetical protein